MSTYHASDGPVATLRDIKRHLAMVQRGDASMATRFARFALEQNNTIEALTGLVENLVKRCDECEASHRKLAKQVTSELESVRSTMTKEISKLKAQVKELRARNRRVDRAHGLVAGQKA